MQISNLSFHGIYLLFHLTTWITARASPICSHNSTLASSPPRPVPSLLPSALSQIATRSRRPGLISITYSVPHTSTVLIMTQEAHGRPMSVRSTTALLSSARTQLETEAAAAGSRTMPLTEGFDHRSNGLMVDAWELYPHDPRERLRYGNVFALLVGLRAKMGALEWLESEFEIHVETAEGRVKVGTGTIGLDGPALGGDSGVEGCGETGVVRGPGAQLTG